MKCVNKKRVHIHSCRKVHRRWTRNNVCAQQCWWHTSIHNPKHHLGQLPHYSRGLDSEILWEDASLHLCGSLYEEIVCLSVESLLCLGIFDTKKNNQRKMSADCTSSGDWKDFNQLFSLKPELANVPQNRQAQSLPVGWRLLTPRGRLLYFWMGDYRIGSEAGIRAEGWELF